MDLFASTISLKRHHYKSECLVRRLDCCVQGQCEGWKPLVCYHQQTAIFPKTACTETVQMYCQSLFEFIPIHRMNLYPYTEEVVSAELENTVFMVLMTCLLCCLNIWMIVARFGCCTAFIGHKMVILSISVYIIIFIYAYSHLFMYYCTHCNKVREHTAITEPSVCMCVCVQGLSKRYL